MSVTVPVDLVHHARHHEQAASHRICGVVELSDIDGLEASAIRDDLMFAKRYASDIDKMAVVAADESWSALTTFIGQPIAGILGVEVRRFDGRVGAWKWLRDESASSN